MTMTMEAPKVQKELAPEVAAAWTTLSKQIGKAFDSLPPISADTVDLHRSLRAQINRRQSDLYKAHREAYPTA
jgi:hypothetical protein